MQAALSRGLGSDCLFRRNAHATASMCSRGKSVRRHPHVAYAVASYDWRAHKPDVKAAKKALLKAVENTGRGVRVQTFQRAALEELQVAVENFGGPSLNYDLLPGKWRLIFTTASDVLPILEAEFRLSNPFGPNLIQVGDIFQRFTSPDVGVVENIIELGLPGLEGRNGITFTVGARYEVRSPHRIALTFEEARVGGIKISPEVEALLAPAMLPRGWLQQQLLLAIKSFQLTVPFRSLEQLANSVVGAASAMGFNGLSGLSSSPQRMSAAYQLTYLDDDMLIGRATSLGGTFIFQRADEARGGAAHDRSRARSWNEDDWQGRGLAGGPVRAL